MKKLFTIDDFMIAIISTLGWGYTELITKHLGLPNVLRVVICIVVGIALEETVSGIIFSKAVQKKKTNRIFVYIAIVILFLIGHHISFTWMGVSLLDSLEEEFAFTILLPVLGFVVSLAIRSYHILRIRKLYGDGSEGYVFHMTDKEIKETNLRNQPILGQYDKECAVKTRTGIFVGKKGKKTVSYLGIPYAKPPVGALRWKAPEPLPDSDAVFEAKHFGASAIQVEQKGSITKHHRQSEDCLCLNIWVGKQEEKEKKPVLVLFHNGDFSYGSSVDPLMDGESFVSAHPEAVLVSFNYRLGIFGFIDFSEVPGGEAYPDAVNLGLLDQVAALKWIRENIAAFGGDPERITVLGFSAGAVSICLLAACERAKGLFQKAFVFNGNLEIAYDAPEASRRLARDLLRETGSGTMAELSRLDTEALKEAAQRLWEDMSAPTYGRTGIPADVYQAYQDGAASGVEFIVGISSREMQVFHAFLGEENFEELVGMAASELQSHLDDPLAGAVREYVDAQTEASGELAAKTKLVEQWNDLCVYRIAAKLAAGGSEVRLMYWDEKPLIENLGSGTVDAAAALLGNSEASRLYGSVLNADLSEALQVLLAKFIKGDGLRLYPNEIKGVDAFHWKAFPEALVVADRKIRCETIENRLTTVKGLLEYAIS